MIKSSDKFFYAGMELIAYPKRLPYHHFQLVDGRGPRNLKI